MHEVFKGKLRPSEVNFTHTGCSLGHLVQVRKFYIDNDYSNNTIEPIALLAHAHWAQLLSSINMVSSHSCLVDVCTSVK